MIRKITHLKTGLLLAAGLFTITSFAQNKPAKKFGPAMAKERAICASTEYENYLQQKFPNRASNAAFEQWLAPKVETQKTNSFLKNTTQVVTIPIVVHIIHNGDAIGAEENITDEQVYSQITVLNQNFRKMFDTPGYNENPVGADMEIEFCLAQRDPNGLATTGIVRYNLGSEESWEMTDVEENLKPSTQWDPEQYLNIWVVNDVYINAFGQIIPLGGYSQFPVASGLEGLDESGAAETDGIVMGYLYFGSSDIYPEGSYDTEGGKDKGDTVTHEMGHFFGLRHIWGDGDCDLDDYCDDTPVAAQANSGCPEDQDTCPESEGLDMIENYMDYTNDDCQNVFTEDQKARAMAVLANSPRRASLITSIACTPGITYDNDGSLNILKTTPGCNEEFAPTIMLTNAGNNTLTSAEISYQLDEQEAVTYSWTGTLENSESATIILPLDTPAEGDHTLSIYIISVNDTDDETPLNDEISQDFSYEATQTYNTQELVVTIQADDYGDEIYWAILDPEENLIHLAGPYDDNELAVETVALEISQCYTFAILDFAGDGICCDYGEGYYEVALGDGTVIGTGGNYTDTEQFTFYVDTTLSTGNFAYANGISLSPNPTNGIININVSNNELPESYTVFNNLGQIVAQAKVSSQSNLTIDAGSYSNGVYFVKVDKNGQSTTLKFVKQ